MNEEYIIISLMYFLIMYLIVSSLQQICKARPPISNPSNEIQMDNGNMYIQIPTETQLSRTNITSSQVTLVPLSSGVNYSQDDPPPSYDECMAKTLDP